MSYVRIAAVLMGADPSISAMEAMRLAHGWTREEAAREWNATFPDFRVTGSYFELWENWQTTKGFAPTVYTLVRLAELYTCDAGDLLAGVGEFRHLDPYTSTPEQVAMDHGPAVDL
jgi:hypothetical protein